MHNTAIEAEFDPHSQEDIDWVTGEIKKILDETPEIVALEKKLGMVKETDEPLQAVIDNLKKVTDVSVIIKENKKMKEKASADLDALDGLNKTRGAVKNKTGNVTKGANGTKAANATAPAAGANATAPAAANATAPAAGNASAPATPAAPTTPAPAGGAAAAS